MVHERKFWEGMVLILADFMCLDKCLLLGQATKASWIKSVA